MENDNTNNLLKEMESSYLKGDFKSAQDLLLKSKDNLDLGLFHYNLGTVFAKEHELGAARYNFEKAKKIGFSYPGLEKNLNLTIKLIEGDSVKFEQNALSLSSSLSLSYVLLFTVCVWLIACLLKKAQKINWRSLGIVTFICLSLVGTKMFYIDNLYQSAINVKKIQIYEGPSDIYSVIKEVSEGHKLIVGKSYEDWVLIEWPIEFAGWIKRTEIGYL